MNTGNDFGALFCSFHSAVRSDESTLLWQANRGLMCSNPGGATLMCSGVDPRLLLYAARPPCQSEAFVQSVKRFQCLEVFV